MTNAQQEIVTQKEQITKIELMVTEKDILYNEKETQIIDLNNKNSLLQNKMKDQLNEMEKLTLQTDEIKKVENFCEISSIDYWIEI